ncbi:PREDICTED: TMV resistance protein N-like [Prunus mume]|uniref:ADP-ribosyl cyclase/cyclic ADP-ribose hydrolase n=1 Tax=Prunus mume TaxID=102107 RepID=A0ABM1LTQ3_PRUMU|nr:PREDICTED: TMV resistance protein N-like [Prunus mume]XP_008237446.1 PREDICTED: TMV resistance protein N-like [Prunus mume]XP_016650780.1 PREDICTED: TMV resistance protein N-like [Prunus mume]
MALSTQRASAFYPSADRSAPPQWNYDVFLSFRGLDTRNSFLSHLYHELQHRGIKTFKDDPKLERGITISSELFKAIQESRLAIVVISPNYASSSWCLDELTKILQCMKSNGTVLPVFFNVDPSDVRKQSGSFADAFAEHEKRFREDIEKVTRWKAALTEVANLSGLDSKNECERKLIEKIVEWVWGKVHHTLRLLDSTELVGIKFTREQMDLLVAPTDDVRFIGIWGMGGIGKTTIAKLVHDSISIHFEVSCFLANVREASEGNRLVDLQRQLLFPILKEQITQVLNEDWGTHFIKNCLCNKKVLLILDDVNASSQLEKFAKEKDWFGKGSIIIITTRDERLVKKHDMKISYKVKGLGDDEALELFSLNAFKKFEPEEGFLELCKCFVNYAGGLPLALKILGCSVYKRDRDEWKIELDKLRKIPEIEIFDLLKISFDRLDEMNKNIFLDVAFFLKGKDKKKVIEILDSCDRCGGINALVEKSLLTIDISNNVNIVGMHDLIQEMAFEIVRQESPEEPSGRSRLCHRNDIIHVLINNTATNKIQGIALRMAELEKADWNCEAFSKMINLKFLEVDNVIISSIPRILPNCLRILKWNWYSSKYLPSNFQPNKLVTLEMQDSKLVRLWDERIDLPNLKTMNLCGSRNLARTPIFTGIPKLQELNLERCENLVEIHPSVANLKWLTILTLDGCKSVKSLPSEVEMDSLICLNLQYCSKLKKIPEFSGQMENLSYLLLEGTSIEKLPSSIGRLVGLTYLNVSNCENLLGLPSEICNLKSLEFLSASGNSFSDKSRFWRGLQRKAFVLGSVHGLWSLNYLNMSDCGLCEGDIPVDIDCLSSLRTLYLNGNNFLSLPASIGCLPKLESFSVSGCQRLQQLPHFRFGLVDNEGFSDIYMYTNDCTSLKTLPKLRIKKGRSRVLFSCLNCSGLVENDGCDDSIILGMLWTALDWGFLQVPLLTPPISDQPDFEIVTPGSRIPEWFNNQSVGDSLIVELPPCTTSISIVFCAVFEEHPNPPNDLCTQFNIDCRPGEGALVRSNAITSHLVSPHLWVSCVYHYVVDKECSQMKISFHTSYAVYPDRIYWSGIKKCGFRLVHKQDVEELNQIMMMNHSINISTKATSPHNSADASGSSHQKSLCRKSYALSKWFLTKLVKIFSLFLTTAVFIKSFNNSEQWGCIGLLIWRVNTLISYLGLAPSYFSLLLKSLIKTVILKRATKFLRPLLKTPPPQMSAHKYLQG